MTAAAAVRGREDVSRLVWHCHRLMFGPAARDLYPTWKIPALGQSGVLFPVLVLLSGLSKIREKHSAHGVSAAVTVHTLSDLELWIRANKEETGEWGLSQMSWLTFHFTGKLYRLGRLQFIPGRFHGNVHLFRHRQTCAPLFLAREGTVYRSDGIIDGTNNTHDEAGRWTANIVRDDRSVRGNPISPAGFAVRDEMDLSLAEWEEVLSPGDPIMEVHISAGERMDEVGCRESLRRAVEFFPAHFPKVSFKNFVCSSWLLDPMYDELLPKSSNIVRFLRLYHLYPDWGDEKEVFYRVFGNCLQDLSVAPGDTGLRRAILNLYSSGRRLIGGGGGIIRRNVQATLLDR